MVNLFDSCKSDTSLNFLSAIPKNRLIIVSGIICIIQQNPQNFNLTCIADLMSQYFSRHSPPLCLSLYILFSKSSVTFRILKPLKCYLIKAFFHYAVIQFHRYAQYRQLHVSRRIPSTPYPVILTDIPNAPCSFTDFLIPPYLSGLIFLLIKIA